MPYQVPAQLENVDPAWAWSAYAPSADAPWDLTRVAHLYRRAAFGASWSQLQQALEAGPQRALEQLFSPADGSAKDVAGYYEQAAQTAAALMGADNAEQLPAWWLFTMLQTPHPLLEKMTLFWHGHFATSAAKVTSARRMYEQNQAQRKHALGHFPPLLDAMAKDPAMLLWLDSATNKKTHPNENFAREVMELFCLGTGNYTERDIKEAARAFTGWELRQERFVFNRYQHDAGSKTLLGQRGHWTGDDVLRILLQQPAAAQFLSRKLFRFFVSETAQPTAELLAPLADGYRQRDYDTAWLVRAILGSNLFFSPHALGQKVKSPVDLGVGLLRALEATTNAYTLAEDLRGLGQGVFYPPNVKGWDGGTEWINSQSVVARINFVWNVVSGAGGRYPKRIDLPQLAARHGVTSPADSVRFLADLLIGAPLPAEALVQLTAVSGEAGDPHLRLARVVQGLAALPEFQLM